MNSLRGVKPPETRTAGLIVDSRDADRGSIDIDIDVDRYRRESDWINTILVVVETRIETRIKS